MRRGALIHKATEKRRTCDGSGWWVWPFIGLPESLHHLGKLINLRVVQAAGRIAEMARKGVFQRAFEKIRNEPPKQRSSLLGPALRGMIDELSPRLCMRNIPLPLHDIQQRPHGSPDWWRFHFVYNSAKRWRSFSIDNLKYLPLAASEFWKNRMIGTIKGSHRTKAEVPAPPRRHNTICVVSQETLRCQSSESSKSGSFLPNTVPRPEPTTPRAVMRRKTTR